MLSRNCNVEQPSLCHWKIWEGEGCYEAEPEELPEYNAVMPAMDRKAPQTEYKCAFLLFKQEGYFREYFNILMLFFNIVLVRY